jgi:hypothetical protein
MDLLGGYDSDNSSGSESPVSRTAENTNSAAIPATSVPTAQQKDDKILKKGRRLLRLNAVLPPEILDRLTKGASSDTDSDSGDDDEQQKGTRRQRNVKEVASKMTRKMKPVNSAADKELDSLLTDLNGFAPIQNIMKTQSTTTVVAKHETLGMAFMKISTSVVRKKRNGDSQVVDIHGTKLGHAPLKKHQDVIVEDVESDSDQDDSETKIETEVETETEPLFPSNAANESRGSTSDRMQSNVPRPMPIPPSGFSARMKRPLNVAPSVSALLQYQHLPEQQIEETQHEQQLQQNEQPKKRSKKELARALRAGNFDSINEYTQKIDSINYTNANEQQYLASSGMGEESMEGSSLKASGMERYVPSEGASLAQSGLSGKMKGKHQIHELVSNAAKFEADQRRMAAMGNTSRQKSSSRADAKKKYGW